MEEERKKKEKKGGGKTKSFLKTSTTKTSETSNGCII
jgi:hypothetical protein